MVRFGIWRCLLCFGAGYLVSRGFVRVVVVCFGLGSECVVGCLCLCGTVRGVRRLANFGLIWSCWFRVWVLLVYGLVDCVYGSLFWFACFGVGWRLEPALCGGLCVCGVLIWFGCLYV